MTEEQIEGLFEEYRQDFLKKTGMKLDCSIVKLTGDQLFARACKYFGNSGDEITNKVRYNSIIEVRQLIVGEARRHNISDITMAVILNCDRTTIINTGRRYEYRYENNKGFRQMSDDFAKFCKHDRATRY